MNEQEFPDLTFTTNQRWCITIGALWTLLMVPSDIAQIKGAGEMEFALTVLGMAGFFILFFSKIKELTNGESLRDLAMRGMKYPWTLMFGIIAWHIFLLIPSTALLFAIFGVPEK